jgi:hypothetical protein
VAAVGKSVKECQKLYTNSSKDN